jgi:predicted nucleotidyltransferase
MTAVLPLKDCSFLVKGLWQDAVFFVKTIIFIWNFRLFCLFLQRVIFISMDRTLVIDNIKQVAAQVLPKGSALYLYGSRARGDYKEDSDWDLLLLIDKKDDSDDFNKYAYPIMKRGFDLWQYFSVHTYSKDEWYNGPHAMFYYNVEQDKQLLYES